MFVSGIAAFPVCGITDMDFVLVTKTSEVYITDEQAKDNIVKYYPKY